MILFCINYETEGTVWKVYMIAKDREDATSHIRKLAGMDKGFRINSVEQREPIHCVTPEIVDIIRPPVAPETVIKPICPWCESTEYESLHALKIHIGKKHASVEGLQERKEQKKALGLSDNNKPKPRRKR